MSIQIEPREGILQGPKKRIEYGTHRVFPRHKKGLHLCGKPETFGALIRGARKAIAARNRRKQGDRF